MTSPAREPHRPRRPVSLAPRHVEKIVGASDPAARTEAAHLTAKAVVQRAGAGDDAEVARLVALVDTEGLDDIAELWAGSPADTLPGALWRLYLLREWIRTSPERAAQWYRLGAGRAAVDDAVAGVVTPPGAAEVAELADSVLAGAVTADLDVALDRAAAFCRVVATGGALDADLHHEPHGEDAEDHTRRAHRLQQLAGELRSAARRTRTHGLE